MQPLLVKQTEVIETECFLHYREVFVNHTVLYDPVQPTDAMLYVGSDDRWIYAVDIISGTVKWKVETREDTGEFIQTFFHGHLYSTSPCIFISFRFSHAHGGW